MTLMNLIIERSSFRSVLLQLKIGLLQAYQCNRILNQAKTTGIRTKPCHNSTMNRNTEKIINENRSFLLKMW